MNDTTMLIADNGTTNLTTISKALYGRLRRSPSQLGKANSTDNFYRTTSKSNLARKIANTTQNTSFSINQNKSLRY